MNSEEGRMKILRFSKGCVAGTLLLCGLAIVDRAKAADGSASPKIVKQV
jgi:hypothetical protein